MTVPKRTPRSAEIINLKRHTFLKRHGRSAPKSFEQLRQRELAWMLYITEGHLANMQHALAVNCVTFNSRDKSELDDVMKDLCELRDKLRTMMKRI